MYEFRGATGRTYLRLAAHMSYTNTAPTDVSGVVEHETATFNLSNKLRSEQVWGNFGNMRRDKLGRVLPDYGEDAGGFAIPGRGSVNHTTFFLPSRIGCLHASAISCTENEIKPAEVASVLKPGARGSVEFSARTAGGEDINSSCSFVVTSDQMREWTRQGWFQATCGP